MTSQPGSPPPAGGDPADGLMNGVRLVPVPRPLSTPTQVPVPTPTPSSATPPENSSASKIYTVTSTSEDEPPAAVSMQSSSRTLGNEATEASGAARETVTVEAPAKESQVLNLSSAVALQIVVFVLLLAGLGAFFFVRRRKKLRWKRHRRLRSTDSNDTRVDGGGGEAELAIVGYRATILGIPKHKRNVSKADSQKPLTTYQRPSDDEDLEAAFPPRDSFALQLHLESPIRSALPKFTAGTSPTQRDTSLSKLELDFSADADGSPSASGPLTSNPTEAGASTQDNNWLPEVPPKATLKIIPVPNYYPPMKFEGVTPTLEEIQEHLTHSNPDGPPRPGVSRSEMRWSATTFSSTFTASTRASTAAYVSPLQPPPLPRKMEGQAWTSPAEFMGEGGASQGGAEETLSPVKEEAVGRPDIDVPP